MNRGPRHSRKLISARKRGLLACLFLTALLFLWGCAAMGPPDQRDEAARLYHYQGLRDELIVDTPKLSSLTAKPGETLTREVTFALLSPHKEKQFQVTETVTLAGAGLAVELSKRSWEKSQGSHSSTIQITVPRDLPAGNYTLVTKIGTDEQQITKKTDFRVLK
jgi:hypothetical protein